VVLDGPPEPFNEDVVLASAAAVHADSDPLVLENLGEAVAGKLCSLIRVEDFRLAVAFQSLLEGLVAEVGVQGVGEPPGEDFAAVPVHDRYQVHKAAGHRNVGDIGRPHLVGVVDRQIAQQVSLLGWTSF